MTANHIGKTMYVAEALPATNDAAGFEALTWVQVKGIQTLPVLGVSYSGIDAPDLATGFTKSSKGAGAGRDTTFTFRDMGGSSIDPGQEDVIGLAEDRDGLGSVKLVAGTGAFGADGPAPQTGDKVEYAQGYFHTFEPNQGTVTTHEGGTCSFRQNDFTIAATEPA